MHTQQNDLRIRPIQPTDSDPLMAMVANAGVFSAEEVDIARELVDGALDPIDDPDPYLILLCEAESRIVGYVCYGHIPMTQGSWDLYYLATDPTFRRKGVAGTLCRAMEDDIRQRGGRQIRVETSSTDGYQSAHRFYERNGYPVVCRLANFYKPGDDLLQMYKIL